MTYLINHDLLGDAFVKLTWQLLQERPAEANISHNGKTTRAEHEAFVLSDPYPCWYAVMDDDNNAVGALYVTDRHEVGIFILKAHQRRGHARAAIQAAMKSNEIKYANVAPNNDASHALFRGLGGKLIQCTYQMP